MPILIDTTCEIFTISNIGAAALRIEDIYHLSGSRDFSWKASDCPASLPFLLAKGESCEMLINFAPTDYGERNASFAIDSNDPDESSLVVDVAGGRDTQYLLVEPTEIDFGEVTVGGNEKRVQILVTNLGFYVLEVNVELRDTLGPLTSSSYDPFSLLFAPEAESTCNPPPFFLSKGQTCSFAVQALPGTSFEQFPNISSGNVVITSSDPDHSEVLVPFEMATPARGRDGCACKTSGSHDGPGGFLFITIFSFVIVFLQRSRLIVGRARKDPNGVGGKT